MFNKIKSLIRQCKCQHDIELTRWHWVHFPNYEPLSIEVEYKCSKCDKLDYLHLYKEKANQWVKAMGNYKKY